MRWNWAIAGWLACMPAPRCAAQERAPDPLAFDRIKAKIAEAQSRLPNYTCTETIERSRRLRSTDAFAFVDTLRLEAALVEGKERFALPGAPQFEEKDLWALVTEGTAFSSGEFALRANGVFLSDSPSYTYAGEQVLNGRRAFHYDFRVALEASHHTIRIDTKQARVGYHGSFWADADTLDLIRIETAADDIPPDIELAQETDAIEYQQTKIGESTHLLPHASELVMIDRGGTERRSRMQFSGCRQYGVNASVIFGDPAPTSPKAQPMAQSRIGAAPLPAVDPVKAARQELPADVLLLARIKTKAGVNLQRLPNYTCTETVVRTRRRRESRKSEPVDTLRLEVALVDGRELFSWPGAGKFEEKHIGEIVGAGAAISNGNFATHARNVFLSRWPTFTYTGETTLDGRRTIRYEYRVPHMLSGFKIRIGSAEAIVGYHGSFWVDADTLDLLRLEVHADGIPASLNLAEASDVMEYHRVRIGELDFLLPEASELTMVDLAGNQSRNRTRLSACRQYTGESVLRFGDPVPEVEAPAAPRKEIRLPAGLIIEVRLDTPIQSGRSATGDVVKAVVGRNVTKDGKIVAPKGAVLTGRLTRLEKHKGQQDYYIVGLSFATIEFDGARGEFHASLQNPGLTQNSRPSFGRMRQTPAPVQNFEPGGDFAIPGSQVSLRRGHSMTWRTEE